MEDIVILKNVLKDYIKTQSDTDNLILKLFINDEYEEDDIARFTGCSLLKINRVIKRLRVYLKKLNYS